MSTNRPRGKTTPASTAGSFTTHAHGAPDVDLREQPAATSRPSAKSLRDAYTAIGFGNPGWTEAAAAYASTTMGGAEIKDLRESQHRAYVSALAQGKRDSAEILLRNVEAYDTALRLAHPPKTRIDSGDDAIAGSGWGDFSPAAPVTAIAQVKEGDILTVESTMNGLTSRNLLRVTSVDTERGVLHGHFASPTDISAKRMYDDHDQAVWDFNLTGPGESRYAIAAPRQAEQGRWSQAPVKYVKPGARVQFARRIGMYPDIEGSTADPHYEVTNVEKTPFDFRVTLEPRNGAPELDRPTQSMQGWQEFKFFKPTKRAPAG